MLSLCYFIHFILCPGYALYPMRRINATVRHFSRVVTALLVRGLLIQSKPKKKEKRNRKELASLFVRACVL